MSDLPYYCHPTALVASHQIGEGTRVWAFCNVQEKAVIGKDCNIGDHCFIEDNVVIGDRVTIKNGVSLWDGVTIGDDAFIGPNAVFTNDVYPRSKVYLDEPIRTVVGMGATVGANAVIVAGNMIGEYAMIGAGAVITKDVPPYTVWYGNPAVMKGYVCRCGKALPSDSESREAVCECGLRYTRQNGMLEAV
jgi:acetyltransferase-like isoleucine patch superfamily enzyme